MLVCMTITMVWLWNGYLRFVRRYVPKFGYTDPQVLEHLDELLHRFGDRLGDRPTLCESANTDYRYRIFMAKSDWTAVLAAVADDLDYDNFKDAAHEELDATRSGREYTRALGDIWETMVGLQDC